MNTLHDKGTTDKSQGKLYAGYGKLTGNRRSQTKGTPKQIQGSAQQRLGYLRDPIGGPAH